jgi:protein-S-isoprenylcysteine O-methyltransferase Ste14
MGRRHVESAGVVAPPPLVYLVGLAAGLALDAALPEATLPGAVRLPVGAVALGAGVALVVAFAVAFRRAATAVRPDRPTTAVVTSGPYRLTRNPGYLGMALMFVGVAVLADAPWALVALIPVLVIVDRGVVAREERYLERKFGQPYLAYKARVRRWV